MHSSIRSVYKRDLACITSTLKLFGNRLKALMERVYALSQLLFFWKYWTECSKIGQLSGDKRIDRSKSFSEPGIPSFSFNEDRET